MNLFYACILISIVTVLPQLVMSDLAYNTPVAVPDGTKSIQDFAIGDEVLAAAVTNAGGSVQLTWSSKTVQFSSGTGPGSSQPIMVYIYFGDQQSLIVTRDQLFLLPTGKLKRADRLVPNMDELVLSEGTSAPIQSISAGAFTGGVHHISTDLAFNGTVDGHLLNVDGVVCGDYTLQIYTDQLGDLLDDGNHPPVVGSSSYSFRMDEVREAAALPEAQQFPDVAYNSTDKNYLVVWEHAYASDLYEIHGVLMDGETGEAIGEPTLLMMDEYSLEAPEIAYNSVDNEYCLVVRRKNDEMAIGQIVSAQGEAVGDPVELGHSGGPTFFSPADRCRVATVAHNATDNRYIVGFGAPMSVQIVLPDLTLDYVSDSLGDGTNPSVSWSSESNVYLMAWEDRETRGTGNENLSGVLINGFAEPLGDMIYIRDQDFAEEAPQIAYNPDDDQFLVVWDERIGYSDAAVVKSRTDTVAQILDANGNLVGDPIPIEVNEPYTLRQDVDYNTMSQIYLVVWKGDLTGEFAFADIYGQFVNRDGSLNGLPFLIYDGGDDDTDDGTSERYYDESKLPVVAANTQTGSFLVVWEEGGTNRNPDDRDILVRIVAPEETAVSDWSLF